MVNSVDSDRSVQNISNSIGLKSRSWTYDLKMCKFYLKSSWLDVVDIWTDIGLTAPCENMSSDICGQRRPRPACTSVQSDQGLCCPQTESLDTIESINGD